MNALLQIRNVPEQARRTLKSRAAEAGVSLNTYLLGVIEREVSRPSVAEVLARAASRTERLTGSAVEAVADARAARDRELLDR